MPAPMLIENTNPTRRAFTSKALFAAACAMVAGAPTTTAGAPAIRTTTTKTEDNKGHRWPVVHGVLGQSVESENC